MGQGGYGVDQAYLWYKRDGTKIEHNIQLFAFIESDFDRMRSAAFLGYSKPRLTVTGGQLSIGRAFVARRHDSQSSSFRGKASNSAAAARMGI
jgi:hypothetical protein